jgi:hypothetical protein
VDEGVGVVEDRERVGERLRLERRLEEDLDHHLGEAHRVAAFVPEVGEEEGALAGREAAPCGPRLVRRVAEGLSHVVHVVV